MKNIVGNVISLKTAKTVQVQVVKQWQHPLYKKSVKRSKTFACHYEGLELHEGDTVSIKSVRPMSKTKKFVVVEIVNKA